MQINNENLISNLSYINKDFQTIYPAMLELAKKLSYRWDPTISDESDPGVVLLKLNALIADKCNYNIDKNILETFPISVTQESNARQLFEQLGYHMKWYQGAKTSVSIKWIGDNSTNNTILDIPNFSMVTDIDNKIVYTLLNSAQVIMNNDADAILVDAIQGRCIDYNINGQTLITLDMIDENNRLYFNDYNIAQNGIFIATSRNNQNLDWNEWVQVDNLYLQTVSDSAYYYKFGVTIEDNICYIEFPDNIAELIGEGLYIKYILTDGIDGNIARNILEKFFNDITLTDPNDETQSVTLNSNNTKLYNTKPGLEGKNPETIDQAYKNYTKTVGTFKTLITLRDYINKIQSTNLVSNGFVCDRTNDIQSTYQILIDKNYINQYETIVDSNMSSNEPVLNAFDLKLYLLTYQPQIITPSQYNKTFELVMNQNPTILDVKQELEQQQCISHDFQNLLPNKICFIKNIYTLKIRIIPKYQLSPILQNLLKANLSQTLYNKLNAKEIDFGQEIDFDTVYSILLNADERIKSISLDDIKYEAYAVYFDEGNNLQEVKISLDDTQKLDTLDLSNQTNIQQKFQTEILAKSILAGKTQLLNPSNTFTYSLSQNYLNTYNNINTITTEAIISPTTEDGNTYYKVRDNEQLLFVAPSLINSKTYTYTVKYIFKANSTPPIDTDYELKEDEILLLYYKVNNTDSFYTYDAYGKGTIIKANFQLDNEIEIPSGVVYKIGINQTADTATTTIVSNRLKNILTANQTISKRGINKLTLNNKYQYYWITNNVERDENGNIINYILFNSGEDEYTLKNGEYLIYTTKDYTEYLILGDGTKVERINDELNNIWSVPANVDTETLLNGSNTSIDWFTLPLDTKLEVTEQQFFIINSGYNVIIEGIDSSTNFSNEPILLQNTKIIYENPNTQDKGTLPTIYAESISWTGQSRLNLNISSTQSQSLLNGQTIKLTYSSKENETTEENEIKTALIEGNDNNPIILLSDLAINIVGGIDILLNYYDYLNNILYPTIYLFNQTNYKLGEDKTGLLTIGNEIILKAYNTIATGSTSTVPNQPYKINYKLPQGTYLLLIDAREFVGNSFSLTSENATITNLINPDTESTNTITIDNAENKIYQFNLVISSDVAQILTISTTVYNTTVSNNTLTLSIPFQYELNLSDSTFNIILDKINTLDTIKKFDFSYIVPIEDLVENPLDAKSFFNTNHIYNKFMICQMKTDDLNENIEIYNGVR